MVVCLLFFWCNTKNTDFGLQKIEAIVELAEKDAFKEKIIRCTAWELLKP